MSPSTCTRCAQSVLRVQLRASRMRNRPPRVFPRRNLSSVSVSEQNSLDLSFVPKNISNAQRPEQFLETLNPPAEAPYAALTVNRFFIRNIDPMVLPLIRAVRWRNDKKWWEEYSKLIDSGQRRSISRTVFAQIL